MDKNKYRLNNETIDWYLGVAGYLYPVTEHQLELFDEWYKSYNFKLKDSKIDIEAIISNKLNICSAERTNIIEHKDIFKSAEKLRMVARKGDNKISKEVIAKMRELHHSKKKDEKE